MKIIVAGVAIIIALVLIGSGSWPFPDSSRTYPGTPLSITIGEKPYENSGLIYIAEDQGYFGRNGINVTMRNYNSGPGAIEGLLNDEVDIGLSSEYVVVGKVFKKENISIIGNIDKYQNIYLFGRKDKGIENISDLKGKKVGITRDGIGEFYLGRFLDLQGMSIYDVTLVDMPPSQYLQAITNGNVDGLLTGIYNDQVQERLGSNVVSWPAQSSQDSYWVMSCQGDWVVNHAEEINRLLKSLKGAEEYALTYPTEAKAIVQKRLNYTDAYIATVWPKSQFSLTLDQSLILAMEDEGRWMITNNLTVEKRIPDFRDYIYTKGLEEVKPESVNIIG